MNIQRSKESTMIQTPPGINGDSRMYSANSIVIPMSPPTHARISIHKNVTDVNQRTTTVWPTVGTATNQRNGAEENEEGKYFN